MRLIFIGPPGSGKGTQAKLLATRLDLRHFSTGEILREAIARDTPEGQHAKPFVLSGQLVPDEVVNDIVNSRFRAPDHPTRFVMDGYPRTIAQARSFDVVLKEMRLPLDAVIFLKVADEEIIRRLSGRWNCPNPRCQATFHTAFNPPQEPGRCDKCGSTLIQREDDKAEIVSKRLKIFHDQYDALVTHYDRSGLLLAVPGIGGIETIYRSIAEGMRARGIK